jgi:hypothetical protein
LCDLLQIVGEKEYPHWFALPHKIFYKDSKPYWVIAVANEYVAAAVKDPSKPFTPSMIKYILELNKEQDIILITDHPDYVDKIKGFLSKHNFRFEIKDGVLFSSRSKQ